MHVGVCRLTLVASQCHSLKEKRSVVQRLKDRVRARFHVSFSEVGGQDTWQRLVLGLAVVSGDRAFVERLLGEIVGFVEKAGLARVVSDEREVLSYGDSPIGEAVMSGTFPEEGLADDDWIPESWKNEEVL